MHSRQKIDLYLIISSVEINDGTPNEIVKLKKKLI